MLDAKKLTSKNRPYTKSYFVKRLAEAGYKVDRLDGIRFRGDDPRYWMVVVSPGDRNIVVICHKRSPSEYHFQLIGRIPIKLVTQSMKVVIDQLRVMHSNELAVEASDVRRSNEFSCNGVGNEFERSGNESGDGIPGRA